jgi:hypothetical protein
MAHRFLLAVGMQVRARNVLVLSLIHQVHVDHDTDCSVNQKEHFQALRRVRIQIQSKEL